MFDSAEAPHLEFEGATLTVGEEIASAMADELESVANLGKSSGASIDAEAHALARELRLWIFMASVCNHADREEREALVERLERLGARAFELVDEEPETTVVRTDKPLDPLATPLPAVAAPFAMRIVDIHGEDGHGFEDEVTDVKRARWERNTNRALSPTPGARAPSGLEAYLFKNEETPPV
jgi:hypothetical protein